MKCRQHLLVVMISVALGACSSGTTAPQMAMPDVDQVRSANLRWNNDLSLSALQQLRSKGTQEALKERVLVGEGSNHENNMHGDYLSKKLPVMERQLGNAKAIVRATKEGEMNLKGKALVEYYQEQWLN